MHRILLALLIFFTLAHPVSAEVPVSPEVQDETLPNFTGKWSLNTRLSDPITPPRPERDRAPQGGRGRGGGGRRGGGLDSGRPSGGDSSGQMASSQNQQKAASLAKELSVLNIFHDGSELNVTNGLDISRLLFTDGRTMTIWTQRGEATATAVWEGQSLVVHWTTRQGTVGRVRSYTLSGDGHRLSIGEKRREPGTDKFREMALIYDKRD